MLGKGIDMAIELKNVSKRFGETRALDDVSVAFGEDRIYGLLGDNGAGKTTLLNVITNRLFADAGEAYIDGMDVRNNDRALGRAFMMGEARLYPDDMRVKRAISTTASFYEQFDTAKAASLCERFGLDENKKITALSTGFASIFRLVLALSVNTPYLLLDEPVLGLDARHRDMFYRLLMEEYSNAPRTVIISTHLISEVEGLIERAVIISKGRIIANAPVDELVAGAHSAAGPAGAVDEYIKGKQVLSQRAIGGLKTACVLGGPGDAPGGVELAPMGLQDYYISLMEGEEGKK